MHQEMQQYVQDGSYQIVHLAGPWSGAAGYLEAEIGKDGDLPSSDQLARLSEVATAEDSSGTRRQRRYQQYRRKRLSKAF